MKDGFYAVVHAATDFDLNHPHRAAYCRAVAGMLAGCAPSEEDMHVLLQGLVMKGDLYTGDVQDAVDAINERFGTAYTINMRAAI